MLQTSLTVAVGLIIFIALIATLGLWFRQSWFRQWLRGTTGIALLAVSVWLGLVVWDLSSYRSAIQERPLATVSIYEVGPQEFDLTLVDSEGEEERFIVRGDQWQLDARLLTWTGPFAAAGVKPLYRLDRLSGRYLSLEQERTAERSVFELSGSRWLDLWQMLYESGLWLDAQFGSAVYMPMINGAVFAVHLTPKGLIARPLNDVAEAALQVEW